MVPASALLFVFAPHVEASRRRYFLAAAWSGAIGTFGAFMLFKPLCEEYEAIVLFYLAMLVATLMLVLMGLSGFRESSGAAQAANSISNSLALIGVPGLTCTALTTPSRSALIASSIFIASSVIRVSPRCTVCPTCAATLLTMPGIGAPT